MDKKTALLIIIICIMGIGLVWAITPRVTSTMKAVNSMTNYEGNTRAIADTLSRHEIAIMVIEKYMQQDNPENLKSCIKEVRDGLEKRQRNQAPIPGAAKGDRPPEAEGSKTSSK